MVGMSDFTVVREVAAATIAVAPRGTLQSNPVATTNALSSATESSHHAETDRFAILNAIARDLQNPDSSKAVGVLPPNASGTSLEDPTYHHNNLPSNQIKPARRFPLPSYTLLGLVAGTVLQRCSRLQDHTSSPIRAL